MSSTKAKELRQVPLFARLSDHDREIVAANVDEVEVPAGTALIREGQSNHAFWVLREGEVEVLVHSKPRRTMGPGDFFGEISMVGRVPATATVIARTPVRAYVLSHAQFSNLSSHQAVLERLQAAMGERFVADRQAEATAQS